MRPDLIGIVLFAVIAAFVLFQLYNVLGRRVGRQPGDNSPAPAPAGPVSLLGIRAREPAPADWRGDRIDPGNPGRLFDGVGVGAHFDS